MRRRLLAVPLLLVAVGCGDEEASTIAERLGEAGGRVLSAPTHPPARTPPDQRSWLTVQLMRSVRLYARPDGAVVSRLAPRTEFDSATILPVVRDRGAWLGVLTTALPNGRIGWVRASAVLTPHYTRYRVVASLSRREVVVRRGGRVVQRFPVAIGSPSTPTPTGTFAVTDKLLTEDPSSPYGCCILALSAHQPRTPQGWGGGDRVAIHATNLPETIGTEASLGCLRGPAEAVRRAVTSVPLGTLVTIRS